MAQEGPQTLAALGKLVMNLGCGLQFQGAYLISTPGTSKL